MSLLPPMIGKPASSYLRARRSASAGAGGAGGAGGAAALVLSSARAAVAAKGATSANALTHMRVNVFTYGSRKKKEGRDNGGNPPTILYSPSASNRPCIPYSRRGRRFKLSPSEYTSGLAEDVQQLSHT
jgi:hypothetical protein